MQLSHFTVNTAGVVPVITAHWEDEARGSQVQTPVRAICQFSEDPGSCCQSK